MKKIFSIIFAFISVMAFAANTGYRGFVINFTDGSSIALTVNDKFLITFPSDYLVITSTEGRVALRINNVDGFDFTTEPGTDDHYWASTDAVTAESWSSELTQGGIRFKSLPIGAVINVIDISGRVVAQQNVAGDYFLDFSAFASGEYIISVCGRTFKIALR